MNLLTYEEYKKILFNIKKANYNVITVSKYMENNKNVERPLIILRHDVEWNVNRALAIANIEKEFGFKSTMYFRYDTKVFNINVIKKLQQEGFEIGYHFNTLDRCKGDFSKAIELFENEIRSIRELGVKIKTVCSHGNPRVKKIGYKVNNEIFIKDPYLRDRNGLLGEAYLDINFNELLYISDAGIKWNNFKTNNELCNAIKNKEYQVIYMLTHPDYWSKTITRAMILHIAAKGIKTLPINKIIANINFIRQAV